MNSDNLSPFQRFAIEMAAEKKRLDQEHKEEKLKKEVNAAIIQAEKEFIYETHADLLKAVVKKLNTTQAKLGDLIGISRNMLSLVNLGKRRFGRQTIIILRLLLSGGLKPDAISSLKKFY